METMRTIQFDVLDTEMLASIEGGTVSAGEVCTLAGEMIGSLVAPRAGTWGGEVFYEHNIAQLYGLSLDFYRKGVS